MDDWDPKITNGLAAQRDRHLAKQAASERATT
jgi:hypothetical protein